MTDSKADLVSMEMSEARVSSPFVTIYDAEYMDSICIFILNMSISTIDHGKNNDIFDYLYYYLY